MRFARMVRLLAVSTLILRPRTAPAQDGYAGANACFACHPAQANRQRLSAHAAALFRAPDHPLSDAFNNGGTLVRPPAWHFEFFRKDGTLQTRITGPDGVMELPMNWAFGAGRQAVTFVTRVDKDFYLEHYASWYPALGRWAATPGQDALSPATLPLAAGVLYKTLDPAMGIAGCFACHSTGPLLFSGEGDITPGDPGVHCEACHGPGAAHAKKPGRGNIENPAKLSAKGLNQFCGKCHRSPADGAVTDWNYSWNVRHQPVYLNQSACFLKSNGRLSCLTCHDPHEPTGTRRAVSYNRICMDCHSASAPPPKALCQERQPANCIDCHMPLVSPQGSLRFTNHWIGVYGDGSKLKPLR